MVNGITFQLPNAHGKHWHELLVRLNTAQYVLAIQPGETYQVVAGELEPLLGNVSELTGQQLLALTNQTTYPIFFSAQSYMRQEDVCVQPTYEAFWQSTAQWVLLIIDVTDVTLYAKDTALLHTIQQHYDGVWLEEDARYTLELL